MHDFFPSPQVYALIRENTIVTEYDTVKAKKIILINEDGKEFLLTVDKEGVLQVEKSVVD